MNPDYDQYQSPDHPQPAPLTSSPAEELQRQILNMISVLTETQAQLALAQNQLADRIRRPEVQAKAEGKIPDVEVFGGDHKESTKFLLLLQNFFRGQPSRLGLYPIHSNYPNPPPLLLRGYSSSLLVGDCCELKNW
jgi:hypothetical protein